MASAARALQSSTRLVAAIALVVACKRSAERAEDRPAIIGDARPAETVRDAGLGARSAEPADAGAGRITLSPSKPTPPGTGLARRCALAGDPLAGGCSGGSGIALDRAGLLYLVDGTQVRRYRAAAGDDCRFEPEGEPIALPPIGPRPQSIDGPVYMRSGGPDWHLTAAGGEVHAHDFVGGLYRIDRGKPEPVCTDVFGYRSVVRLGKRWLAQRGGLMQLEPRGGGKCKAGKPDPEVRGELYAVRDRLYTIARAGGELIRRDGRDATRLAADTRLCAIAAITACGDGICALDHNCPQLVEIGADDGVRAIDAAALFDVRPWSLDGAVTTSAGAVLVLARHRDARPGGKDEVCETVVYRVIPAVFAR